MLLLIDVWYSTLWVPVIYWLDSLLLDIATTFKMHFILWMKKNMFFSVWINIILKTKEICLKNLVGSGYFYSSFKILPSF